jgi:GxxExxY protein
MKEDYIFSKETYKLRGIFFDIHNKPGSIQKEKAYSNALEIVFKKSNIPYEREKKINLDFEGEKIGTLYLDFITWNKIVIEVKAKRFFTREDFRQTLRYLKSLNLPLALLVNFKSDKVKIKRIINTKH